MEKGSEEQKSLGTKVQSTKKQRLEVKIKKH